MGNEMKSIYLSFYVCRSQSKYFHKYISRISSLRRLTETGIMDRQRKVFRTEKPKCIRNIQAADFTVDMTAIYPALILLFFGILLSFAVLAIEIGIHHVDRAGARGFIIRRRNYLGGLKEMTPHSSIKV